MGKLKTIISSYKTSIFLLSLYAVILAIATIIEKYYGTSIVKIIIYYSPFFIFLQFLMVVNFVMSTIKKKLLKRKKWGFIVIHFSLIAILAGAFVSFVTGEEGIVHIREGEVTNKMIKEEGKEMLYTTLPFRMELVKFNLERYPGSSSPSSFESHLIIHDEGGRTEKLISMNNILDIKGYRFFQSSYDEDEKGTVLSVNRDVAGRNVTYTGYFLLIVGFMLSLTGRNSRFRQLNRQLNNLKKPALTIVLLFFSFAVSTNGTNIKTQEALEMITENKILPEHAAKFGALPILTHKGRVEPVNTFSSELLRKLHKSETFEDMDSDQFLLSVLTYPDVWMSVPLIEISNSELSFYYDLSNEYCAYLEAFDNDGNYKLTQRLQEVYRKLPADRTRFDKDLMKLDEQMNIFHQLINYGMINIFPKENDPHRRWYAPGEDLSGFSDKDSLFVSYIIPLYAQEIKNAIKTKDWAKADETLDLIINYQKNKNTSVEINPKKIEAELIYNKLGIFNLSKKIYLIFGGLLLVVSFIYSLKERRWMLWTIRGLSIVIIVSFVYHLSGISLRGYISGYAPWSNAYETMVYVSWVTVLGGLFFIRKNPVTFALASLFGGVILFVSGLNWMDPQISPLVPVLKSPWLMFHVAVIVAAYGFFGISCLVGLTNLCMMFFMKEKLKAPIELRIRELSIINEMSMLVGLALMTIGTFLGAVWANESWGRYWGWDPKETWALITMIVYTINLHLRLVKKWDNVWLFNFVSVISIFSVLMTYFGVNYFLSGMHSYGRSNLLSDKVFVYLFIAALFVLILGILSYKKYKKSKELNTEYTETNR